MKIKFLFLLFCFSPLVTYAYGLQTSSDDSVKAEAHVTPEIQKQQAKVEKERLKQELKLEKMKAKTEVRNQELIAKQQKIEANRLEANIDAQKKEQKRLKNIQKKEKLIAKLNSKLSKKELKLNKVKTILEKNKIDQSISPKEVSKAQIKVIGIESDIREIKILLEKENKLLLIMQGK